MPDSVTCNGKQVPLEIFMKLTIILITAVWLWGCQLILFFLSFFLLGDSFGRTIEFRMVTRELCKLPTFFTTALFFKIDKESTGFVARLLANFSCLQCELIVWQTLYYFHYSREAFIDFWVNSNLMSMDSATQVFTILKQQNRNYLKKVTLSCPKKKCSKRRAMDYFSKAHLWFIIVALL